jgi:flagellar motility protein MotE (MotC chaperone)
VIVTRRRRKPFPWRRLILPVVAIGLVAFAIAWPPSRNVVTGGPLGPLWQNLGGRFDTIAAPFHFAAQNQLLTDRNRQIVQLQTQITTLQTQSTAKDKQISALNAQIGQFQAQAASSRGGAASPSTAPASSQGASATQNAAAGASNGADPPSSNATTEMRRTAQVWANMEPENAAKVVERLPVPYVAQVLALMSPDDAGAILDAVPPAFAAQLTQENPGLKT